MCIVSAVYEYGRRLPETNWNTDALWAFQRMIANGQQFDKATGQPDCEDPAKAEFMQRVLDRLDGIEKKIAELKTGAPCE